MGDPYTYIRDGEILTGEDGMLAKVKSKASEMVNKLIKSNIDKAKTVEEVPDEQINNLVSVFKDGALKFKPGLETKRDNSSLKTTSNQSTEINHSTDGNKNVSVENSTKEGSTTWKDGGHTTFTLGGDPIVDGGAGAHLDADYKTSSTRIKKESDPNSEGFNYRGVDVNKSATAHVKTGGHVEVCGRHLDVPIDVHGEANCGYSHSKEDGTIHNQSTDGNKLIDTTESTFERSVGARAGASGGLSVRGHAINADAGARFDAGCKLSSTRIKKESDPNSDGFNYKGVDVNKSASGHVKTGGHVEVCGRHLDVPIDVHGEANCGYSHSKEDGTIHNQSTDGNKFMNTTESKYERSIGARAGASGGLSLRSHSINADASARFDAGCSVSSKHIDGESLPNIDGYEYEGTETEYAAGAHVNSEAHLNASANVLGKTAGVNTTGKVKADAQVSCSHQNFKEKSSTSDETRENRVFHKVKAEGSGEFDASVNANAFLGDKSKDIGASVKAKTRGSTEATLAEWSYTKNKEGLTGHFESLSAEAKGEAELEASNGSKSVKMMAKGRVAAKAVEATADLTVKKDEHKTSIGGIHANIGHLSARGRAGIKLPGKDEKSVEAEAEFKLASVNALQAEVRDKEHCDEADIHVKSGLVNANIGNAKVVGEKTGKKATMSMDSTLAELNAGNVSITGIDNRESNRTGVNTRISTTPSANIGNVDITGLGSRETRFEANTAPGVDAFNFQSGFRRNTGGSASTCRASYFNIDLTIGLPKLDISSGPSFGNIAIPFFGGGGSGGGGGGSRGGKQTGEKDVKDVTGNGRNSTDGNNTGNGGNGTVENDSGNGGNSTGNGGNCTGRNGTGNVNDDVTSENQQKGAGTGGNSTGNGGNSTGNGGNGTVENYSGNGGNSTGNGGNGTVENYSGNGGNGTVENYSGNGGNSTSNGRNGTGRNGSGNGNEDVTSENLQNGGNGTSTGGNSTGNVVTVENDSGNGGKHIGNGGKDTDRIGTGNGRHGTGTSGNGTGSGGTDTGNGENGTNYSENGTGTGGNGTNSGGNGTVENDSGNGGNGTVENDSGNGGNGTVENNSSNGRNGTVENNSGTGRNGTGNSYGDVASENQQNVTGTGGNSTYNVGNGSGSSKNDTVENGSGNGGNDNDTKGNGTGRNGTGNGRNGSVTSGNVTGTGGNDTATIGNGTVTGRNVTGTIGHGTGNGGNGTGYGGNWTGYGGNCTGKGGNGTGIGGNGTGYGGNGTGDGGNSTGNGGNGTDNGGNDTVIGGNGTGPGRNVTGDSGHGTGNGGNGTDNGGHGTGCGGNGTDNGGHGTGNGGNATDNGGHGTGCGGNCTGKGGNGTGICGNGTGNGGNGTGLNGVGDVGLKKPKLNLRDTADQNRMLAQLVGKYFTKASGNPRSTINQSSGGTPIDWSNTEKIEEHLYKKYDPNYTPDDKQSGSSQSGSRDSRKSKPQQKQPPQKPSGSNKNIHTIFTIGAGDSKPIQKLSNNVYGFGNDE